MKLKITVENNTYEVDVEAAEPEVVLTAPRSHAYEPASVRVPAAAAASPVAGDLKEGAVNEEKVCRSPISGIVVKVAAQPGQAIQIGDVLMVLEAMKMETNITAPIAGKIAKINVIAGAPVKGGQVVVEFE